MYAGNGPDVSRQFGQFDVKIINKKEINIQIPNIVPELLKLLLACDIHQCCFDDQANISLMHSFHYYK